MSQGFDLYANRATLTFEQTRYKGAEICVRLDMPLEDFLAHDATETHDDRLRWFAEHAIESWNLEAGGKPMELSPEAFMALPRQFTNRVHEAWLRTIQDPDIPLAQPSNDGDTSAPK